MRLAGAALVLALAAPAGAAPAPPPAKGTGSWAILCGKAPGAPCVASQAVATDRTGRKVVLGAILVLGKPGQPAQFHLRVAPGIDRNAGFGMKLEDGSELRLPVAACSFKSCEASGRLTPAIRARFTKARNAQVAWRLGTGQQMLVPLDLRGFGAALAALEARPQTLKRKLSTSPSTTT
ncbi:invasion associated locus B family protein [Glacieibacterium frigidum]|uniref:invasion associated locus B family protein n=1 Tax=Glacieibacterium frigidum TaxID=2593303 RepID=UPI00163D93BD|nr:invasion associated locus B family protein [Glacieibacterium frigidum]